MFLKSRITKIHLILIGIWGVAALLPLPEGADRWTPVTPILAEEISPGCDHDGDEWWKDSRNCISKYGVDQIDCDDSDANLQNDCAAPAGTNRFAITVRFGDQGDYPPNSEYDLNHPDYDCESSDSCIETYFETEGEIVCGSQVCDFLGTVDTVTENFGITPALFNLLALTEIRRTVIEPHKCFVIPRETFPPDKEFYTSPGRTLHPVYEFELRSPVGEGKWWAKVRAHSLDMNLEEQRYGFHFGGECDRAGSACPPLDGMAVNTDYVFGDGFTSAVFGSGTNKLYDGQTCRCTVSSKPSCPENVEMPEQLFRPAGAIFVTKLE